MTCPLCRNRRGKRLCPAKGESICSQCCGTKRRIEIDCPPGCAFLDGAQAGAWDGRSADRDRDARRIGPFLEGLTEAQGRRTILETREGCVIIAACFVGQPEDGRPVQPRCHTQAEQGIQTMHPLTAYPAACGALV